MGECRSMHSSLQKAEIIDNWWETLDVLDLPWIRPWDDKNVLPDGPGLYFLVGENVMGVNNVEYQRFMDVPSLSLIDLDWAGNLREHLSSMKWRRKWERRIGHMLFCGTEPHSLWIKYYHSTLHDQDELSDVCFPLASKLRPLSWNVFGSERFLKDSSKIRKTFQDTVMHVRKC